MKIIRLAAVLFILIPLAAMAETSVRGKLVWNYETGSTIFASPAILSNRVYFGVMGNKFYSLEAWSGQIIWNFSSDLPDNTIVSSAFAADDKIYLGTFENKTMYCMDAATGKKIWSFAAGEGIESSPRVVKGKLYFGSWDYSLYCLDAATGRVIWKFDTANIVSSSPCIVNGKVYVGSFDKKMYCVDAETGKKIWEFQSQGQIYSSPFVSGTKVYFGCQDNRVYCLDAATGEKIWDYKTGKPVVSSPSVVKGKLYVGSSDNKLYCLDAESGKKIWDFQTGNEVFSSPCIADDWIFFGSYDKNLYCLDINTGKKVWQFQASSAIDSSPCVEKGKVFFGDRNGKFYCVDSGEPNISGHSGLGNQPFTPFVPEVIEVPQTNKVPEVVSNTNAVTNIQTNVAPVVVQITNVFLITNEVTVTNSHQFFFFNTNWVTNLVTNIISSGTPAKTAVVPASAADDRSGTYAVQAGSFVDDNRAMTLYDKLRTKGFDVYTTSTQVKGKTFIRIRIGSNLTADEADALIQKLKSEGFTGVSVKLTR